MTDDDQEKLEAVKQSAADYYTVLVNSAFDIVAHGHLSIRTAISTMLSAASGVAAQLDEPGIELFEELSADIARHMRESKSEYDAAVDPARLN